MRSRLKRELSLRRNVGFDIPLLPFPARRIFPAVQILISSMAVQNPPALLPPKSARLLPIRPSRRCRSQPLPGVSRKQRYNALDFPTENRVPTGVLLAPIGNPEPKGLRPSGHPPIFFASGTQTVKIQFDNNAQKIQNRCNFHPAWG